MRLSADGRRPKDVRARPILPIARPQKPFRNRWQLLRVFAWNAWDYYLDNGAGVARFGVPGRSDEERGNLNRSRRYWEVRNRGFLRMPRIEAAFHGRLAAIRRIRKKPRVLPAQSSLLFCS